MSQPSNKKQTIKQKKPEKARCGAKTRAGTPCKQYPMHGKKRCRLHGGKSTGSPKGCQNAWKTGIYAQGIRPEEAEVYEKIKVGSLDADIRIMKLQLIRAVKAQKEFEDANPGIGLETIESRGSAFQKTDAGWTKKEILKKHPDYRKIIFQLSGRIAKLELTRSAIGKDTEPEHATLIVNFGNSDDPRDD